MSYVLMIYFLGHQVTLRGWAEYPTLAACQYAGEHLKLPKNAKWYCVEQ
jgi:hypothetical protein